MAHFKQAIQIGNNVTEIMKLPCVLSCSKEVWGEEIHLRYELLGKVKRVQLGSVKIESYRCYAYAGDWLCEDAEGTWHLLTNEEYEANKEQN